MKKSMLLLVLCVSLSSTYAADDRAWVNYQRLLEITRLDKYYATPPAQRDKVRMYGTFKPNNAAIATAEVVFTVVHGTERKRIAVAADGSFDPAIDPAWARSNPQVLTNLPDGEKGGFGFGMAPIVPAGLQFDYTELMGSVPQSNALIKAQAGLMRFMMPTFVGLSMQFPRGEAASARILSRQGGTTIAADGNGVLRLTLDEALLAENPRVTLSQRPHSFDLIAD